MDSFKLPTLNKSYLSILSVVQTLYKQQLLIQFNKHNKHYTVHSDRQQDQNMKCRWDVISGMGKSVFCVKAPKVTVELEDSVGRKEDI